MDGLLISHQRTQVALAFLFKMAPTPQNWQWKFMPHWQDEAPLKGEHKIHSLSSRSYGILAKEKIGRSWITVAVTAPFSNDYGTAHQLAESCSARQLSPPHLVDVVSDFIS